MKTIPLVVAKALTVAFAPEETRPERSARAVVVSGSRSSQRTVNKSSGTHEDHYANGMPSASRLLGRLVFFQFVQPFFQPGNPSLQVLDAHHGLVIGATGTRLEAAVTAALGRREVLGGAFLKLGRDLPLLAVAEDGQLDRLVRSLAI